MQRGHEYTKKRMKYDTIVAAGFIAHMIIVACDEKKKKKTRRILHAININNATFSQLYRTFTTHITERQDRVSRVGNMGSGGKYATSDCISSS